MLGQARGKLIFLGDSDPTESKLYGLIEEPARDHRTSGINRWVMFADINDRPPVNTIQRDAEQQIDNAWEYLRRDLEAIQSDYEKDLERLQVTDTSLCYDPIDSDLNTSITPEVHFPQATPFTYY
jgi:hypothetical protein